MFRHYYSIRYWPLNVSVKRKSLIESIVRQENTTPRPHYTTPTPTPYVAQNKQFIQSETTLMSPFDRQPFFYNTLQRKKTIRNVVVRMRKLWIPGCLSHTCLDTRQVTNLE